MHENHDCVKSQVEFLIGKNIEDSAFEKKFKKNEYVHGFDISEIDCSFIAAEMVKKSVRFINRNELKNLVESKHELLSKSATGKDRNLYLYTKAFKKNGPLQETFSSLSVYKKNPLCQEMLREEITSDQILDKANEMFYSEFYSDIVENMEKEEDISFDLERFVDLVFNYCLIEHFLDEYETSSRYGFSNFKYDRFMHGGYVDFRCNGNVRAFKNIVLAKVRNEIHGCLKKTSVKNVQKVEEKSEKKIEKVEKKEPEPVKKESAVHGFFSRLFGRR